MPLMPTDRGFINAFAVAAEKQPEAVVRFHSPDAGERVMMLVDIYRKGCRVGRALQSMGIGKGDVVATMLPGWPEWLTAFIGASYAGAVFMPVSTIYKTRELSFILRQSRASVIVTPTSYRGVDYARLLEDCGDLPALNHRFLVDPSAPSSWHALEESESAGTTPAETSSRDVAFMVFTSGTTSAPKGVLHSASTLLGEIEAQKAARADISNETILCPWPPGHVAGALQMLRFLVSGTPLIVMEKWDAAEAARLIETHKATTSSGTPFHMAGLLDAAEEDGRSLSSLQSYVLGAAPVPAALVQACEDRGIVTVHSYGSSEHPTVTMAANDDPLEKRLHTEGRPMHGNEIRIVDEAGSDLPVGEPGEILTRGPERFLGYLDKDLDKQAFLPGGWYRTGDVGRLDEDGFLLITDRKKDIIIRGGENISSRDVEDVARLISGVRDSAAVAVPDDRLGERIKLFVEMESGETMNLDAMQAHYRAQGVASQKIPEFLEIIDSLPRNDNGKVLKVELRNRRY
ncbi:cyclohexanecarboxylate-CoA ligase [Henriciella mobilis]|uniref:class I adenylate-forming enzyme family protein n=2 Tax=Henriciella mobilis TaxID=2305467 RepID=UPI000E66098F|nr:AMP-binding protein [Henriciella mobilis]RIJ17261.1 cyclohexanecarboxylate-CoA ligase [Henriciella mobilis]RIJ22392.1 cyclohexanecarboxylate-CoA ligase [Henriciella mobilis]